MFNIIVKCFGNLRNSLRLVYEQVRSGFGRTSGSSCIGSQLSLVMVSNNVLLLRWIYSHRSMSKCVRGFVVTVSMNSLGMALWHFSVQSLLHRRAVRQCLHEICLLIGAWYYTVSVRWWELGRPTKLLRCLPQSAAKSSEIRHSCEPYVNHLCLADRRADQWIDSYSWQTVLPGQTAKLISETN